jgi:threonine/homoserine/homoserine lactone efflux protein
MLASLLAFAIAAGSPGPATLAVSGTAMARGHRAGLAMAAGLTLGLALWGLVAALGFGTVVARAPAALMGLKLLGGAYLLYLAWVTGRAALAAGESAAVSPQGGAGRRLFRRGLLLNLGNPKAVLTWLAVLALAGLEPGAGLLAFVALSSAVGGALYAAYALIFSRAPVMAFYARQRRRIEAGFAALFGLAGLRLLLWRAT